MPSKDKMVGKVKWPDDKMANLKTLFYTTWQSLEIASHDLSTTELQLVLLFCCNIIHTEL